MGAADSHRHGHVGIVGLPYCGSTIIGRLFSCVPGVAPAGEVGWLVTWPSCLEAPPTCTRCGEACPVWTPQVRYRPWNARNLLRDVAALFDAATTIVLGDKYPALYDAHGLPERAVLLFRHPVGMALSAFNHDGTAPERYYDVWAAWYRDAMAWCAARFGSETVYVDHDAFMARPDAALTALCGALGLTAPVVPLPLPEKLEDHYFAGNRWMGAHRTLAPDQRWRTERLPQMSTAAAAVLDVLRGKTSW